MQLTLVTLKYCTEQWVCVECFNLGTPVTVIEEEGSHRPEEWNDDFLHADEQQTSLDYFGLSEDSIGQLPATCFFCCIYMYILASSVSTRDWIWENLTFCIFHQD